MARLRRSGDREGVITARRAYMATLGFSSINISRISRSRPCLYSKELIDAKCAFLRKMGITNPIPLMENYIPSLNMTQNV